MVSPSVVPRPAHSRIVGPPLADPSCEVTPEDSYLFICVAGSHGTQASLPVGGQVIVFTGVPAVQKALHRFPQKTAKGV